MNNNMNEPINKVNLEQMFYEIHDHILRHGDDLYRSMDKALLEEGKGELDITYFANIFNEFLYFSDRIERMKKSIEKLSLQIKVNFRK